MHAARKEDAAAAGPDAAIFLHRQIRILERVCSQCGITMHGKMSSVLVSGGDFEICAIARRCDRGHLQPVDFVVVQDEMPVASSLPPSLSHFA